MRRTSSIAPPKTNAKASALLERVPQAGRVLDIGAGEGYLARRAPQPGGRFAPIDAERVEPHVGVRTSLAGFPELSGRW